MAIPKRVRAVTIICLVAGIALLDESGLHGALGWVGGLLFSMGVGLLDGLGEGRMGSRQAGLVLFLVGIGTATWALLVIFLTEYFLAQVVSLRQYLLLVGGIAAFLAGARMRRPVPGVVRMRPRGLLDRARAVATSARAARAA